EIREIKEGLIAVAHVIQKSDGPGSVGCGLDVTFLSRNSRLLQAYGCRSGVEDAPLRSINQGLRDRKMVARIGLGHGREGRDVRRASGSGRVAAGLLSSAQEPKQEQQNQAANHWVIE